MRTDSLKSEEEENQPPNINALETKVHTTKR